MLYKTGILVDNFSNYGSGYVNKPEFTAAIDTARQECRPAFAAIQHNLFFVTDPDVAVFNDFITMKYTEEEFISQTIASGTDSNPNPSGIVADNGRAVIYPPVINSGYNPEPVINRGYNPDIETSDNVLHGGAGS